MVHLYNGIYFQHQKDEIIPCAATWMGLEIVILSEVSQTEKEKYHMTFLTCKGQKEMKQMNLQKRNRPTDLENKLMVVGGRTGGRDSQEVWSGHVHAAVFKMDNQQGPTVQHGELCSRLHGSLDGRGVLGRLDTWICMAESLSCSPFCSTTITTLLLSYTPVPNKKCPLFI